jgi:hypothetical protein
MSFSATQDRAVNLVTAALAHDVLSFGTVKKGDKLDMLLDYVDEVTNRFLLATMHAHERLQWLESGEAPPPGEDPAHDDMDEE